MFPRNQAKTDKINDHPEARIPVSQVETDSITESQNPEASVIPITEDHHISTNLAESYRNEDDASTPPRLVYKRKVQADEEEMSTIDDGAPSWLYDGRSHSCELHRQQNTRQIVSLSPDPVEQVRQMEEHERLAMMLLYSSSPDPVERVRQMEEDERLAITLQEALSPDPVEQVRQMEEDESLAMTFQAQFNGEISPYSSDMNHLSVDHHLSTGFRSVIPHFDSDDSDDDSEISDGYDDFDDEDDVILRGLSKREINRIPTRKYIHPNSLSSSSSSKVTHKRIKLNTECGVCHADYELGDKLRTLLCCHEFHTSCVDPWLKVNQTCPICRLPVDG